MIKVRNSGINPFLVNPIKAVLNGEDVGISHALSTGDGLQLGINYKDGKYGMVHIDAIELLNKHELERFKMMLKMLGKRYVSEQDLKIFG